MIIDLCGENEVYDLTDELNYELICRLLSLPKSLIKLIFEDFLKVKDINYVFYGNLTHIKNALYNESVIERYTRPNKKRIKWGKIYKYQRMQVYELLNRNQHLNNVFCDIFKNSKKRAENVSQVKIGTIISIQTIDGEISYYYVDALKTNSALGVKILMIDNIEIKNSDDKIVSNKKNTIHLLPAQRWLNLKYLKQEHIVFLDFQPIIFFVDNFSYPVQIMEYSRKIDFFDLEQTKLVSDFTFSFVTPSGI